MQHLTLNHWVEQHLLRSIYSNTSSTKSKYIYLLQHNTKSEVLFSTIPTLHTIHVSNIFDEPNQHDS